MLECGWAIFKGPKCFQKFRAPIIKKKKIFYIQNTERMENVCIKKIIIAISKILQLDALNESSLKNEL